MRKALGAGLVFLGVVLLFYGFYAEVTPQEAILGRHSERTVAYIAGGALSLVAGLVLLFVRGREQGKR